MNYTLVVQVEDNHSIIDLIKSSDQGKKRKARLSKKTFQRDNPSFRSYLGIDTWKYIEFIEDKENFYDGGA